VTVADIDAEFLPLIYDIVKCVERDPGDAAAKNKVCALPALPPPLYFIIFSRPLIHVRYRFDLFFLFSCQSLLSVPIYYFITVYGRIYVIGFVYSRCVTQF
jgi:hypothetical protein